MSDDLELMILLVGMPGSGKTTWLKRLLTGEFTEEYKPTVGAYCAPIIRFKTPRNPVALEIVDVGGQPPQKGIAKYLYPKIDGIIFFGDYSRTTEENNQWFRQYNPDYFDCDNCDEPIILYEMEHVYVLNKVDILNKQIDCDELERDKERKTIQISVKNDWAIMRPLAALVAQYMEADESEITMISGITPEPESQISYKLAPLSVDEEIDELINLTLESNRRTKTLLRALQEKIA